MSIINTAFFIALMLVLFLHILDAIPYSQPRAREYQLPYHLILAHLRLLILFNIILFMKKYFEATYTFTVDFFKVWSWASKKDLVRSVYACLLAGFI